LEQKYADVQAIDDLLPLCFQILRFKMRDYKRKATRRGEWNPVDVHDIHLADQRPTPADQAERDQLLERLSKAVEKLDGRCRELMRLKLLGRSFPEIQTTLGAASINTVYTWDSRCRQTLLAKMGGSWEVRR
jgi:RNA polymerase sigma-70 factor (ECF subfamily)